MHMKQQGTNACKMRDELENKLYPAKFKFKVIEYRTGKNVSKILNVDCPGGLSDDELVQWLSEQNNLLTDIMYQHDWYAIIDYERPVVKPKLPKNGGRQILPTPISEINNKNWNGVILPNGDVYTCEYMGHTTLYRELYHLNIVDNSDWMDSKTTFHVSSGALSCNASSELIHRFNEISANGNYPEIQWDALKTVWLLRDKLTFYAEKNDNTVGLKVFEYVQWKFGNGGKYGGLKYIQTFLPHIKTPAIHTENIFGETCFVRSSPLKSIPGALFSEKLQPDTINRLKIKFDSLPDQLKTHNKLFWFYQEFVEGKNGVCHISKDKFEYALGDKQGDVVFGRKSNQTLTNKGKSELHKTAIELLAAVQCDNLQLEFVENNDEITILQIKVLKNNAKQDVNPPKTYTFTGKSFCSYVPFGKWNCYGTVNRDNVLVVDTDCEDSTTLIGKQFLIVRQDVQFSHVLALSKVLNIPSIYAVGDVEIPESFDYELTGEIGYII